MPRRRGRSGNAGTRRVRSPNYAFSTRRPRGIRRLVKTNDGQPGEPMLQPGTSRYRNIRRLHKVDPSKGITQPEARQALLTGGNVKVDDGGESFDVTILSKSKTTGPLANITKVRPPRLGPLKRRGNAT